jgi:hypothetical protein
MGGKQLSALVEIVWTKLNVVGSGGRVGGMETGRRNVQWESVGISDALESSLSLPVIPV